MLLRNLLTTTAPFLMNAEGGAGGGGAGVVVPAAGGAPAGGAAPAAGSAAPAGGAPAAGAAAPAAGAPAAPAGGAAPAAGAAAPAAGTPPGDSAPAAGAAAAPGTIAGGAAPKPTDGAPPAPATFPEKWREELAGGDAAFAKVLERYASPKAFADAHRALVAKVSSGELKNVAKAPPENATPEQIAEWRKEAGLPADAKGYVDGLKLPNGVVPGAADKPLLEGFAAHALAKNMSPDAYNSAVDWYFANVDAQTKARATADHNFASEAVRTLEAEWGPAFTENQNRIGALFADTPEVAEILFNARDSKGRIIGNIPEVNRALAQLHRTAYPAYTPTTPDNASSAQAVATEMSQIEALMGDPRSKYNEKNSSGQLSEGALTMRARYRTLIEQQEKNKQRAA
ncbi:hypothetical protein ACVWW6_006034 [Bradyrhizobium sp. USDA 3311]